MRVYLDMDNTLVDYNEAALEWYNKKLKPEHGVKESDLTEYAILKDFGIRVEYERDKLNSEMWMTRGFWRGMSPNKNALNVVRGIMKKHDVWVKTRAQLTWLCVEEKYEWLRMHLRDLADKIIFLPSQGTQVLNGDVLVDDDYRALSTFQGKRVMFAQYYNRHMSDMFGYYVTSWDGVGELFDGAF